MSGEIFISYRQADQAKAKLGFVDYWKQTKTQLDVCETAEERGIPVCVALRS